MHADLRALSDNIWNKIVVDGRGHVYVNGGPGIIALVTPDGAARQVADGIAFPNGMAVMPDNRTLIVAESYGKRLTAFEIAEDGRLSNRRLWADLGGGVPDGICIDAEHAVWYADVPNKQCVRVREGGDVLQTIGLDRGCFACMLGGEDGSTLFMIATEWRGMEKIPELARARTGLVLTARHPRRTRDGREALARRHQTHSGYIARDNDGRRPGQRGRPSISREPTPSLRMPQVVRA